MDRRRNQCSSFKDVLHTLREKRISNRCPCGTIATNGTLFSKGLSFFLPLGAPNPMRCVIVISLRYKVAFFRVHSDIRKASGFVITTEPLGFVLTKRVGDFLLRV